MKKHQKLKKGKNSIFTTFRKFILTTFTKIDATGTKMNFFEFWFFCWVTKSTYYERLRRFLRLLKKISLQLQLYVKWKSYAIGESSFDKLCKNCRYSHKNQLFWVLIFLLSHKFVILLPPKRIWSYSKKWACSATLKITVFFIFAIVTRQDSRGSLGRSNYAKTTSNS